MTSVPLMIVAILPSMLLLWYFHSRDKHPEPRHVVWITFWLGVLIVVPVVIVGLPVMLLLQNAANPFWVGVGAAFLAAAIPEEFFKFLVVTFYAARHKEFDEPMDGMVYGAAASLGFATVENLLYVWQGGWPVAVARALVAVPMHALLGAIMGYYVGQWKFHGGKRSGALFKGLLIPMLLHGLFDVGPLTLLAMHQRGQNPTPGESWPLLALSLVPFALLIGQFLWVLRIQKRLRSRQDALASRGL